MESNESLPTSGQGSNFNRVQQNCSEQTGRSGNGERCRLNSVTTPDTLTALGKQYSSKYFYSKTNQMHQCLKFILFWSNTPKENQINLIHRCIWLVLLQKYITMHGPMNIKFLTISGYARCRISNPSNMSFYAGTAGHKISGMLLPSFLHV